MTKEFLLHKDKEEKGKCHCTKARVWLPFPVTVPSLPHTCFFSDPPDDNKLLINY